jgi:hypothetical protein
MDVYQSPWELNLMKTESIAAVFFVLGFGAFAMAGELVEVKMVSSPSAASTPQLAQMPKAPPADATLLLSIEAAADEQGDFHAKCISDGKTIQIGGRVTTMSNGERQLRIEFSANSPGSTQGVSSNIMLNPDTARVIGGLLGGSEPRLIVATVKPPEKK